jgi:hypothetical protein
MMNMIVRMRRERKGMVRMGNDDNGGNENCYKLE